MKGIRFLLALVLTSVIVACQKDIPEPETKPLTVSAAQLSNKPNKNLTGIFIVRPYVRGNDVQIECMIRNFTFQDKEGSRAESGTLLIYLDGKLYKEVSTAAFVLKNLKSGTHRIFLQIVDENGHKTSFKREIIVNIP
ncbi:hypothetical protein [Pseudoneobacillus sp. C159]